MRSKSVTAVLALLAVMATVIVADAVDSRVAEAQPGAIVGRAALGVATDVVNGSVIATQSVDTGSAVFSLAVVEVTSTVTGDLSGQIFVEVPGGKTAGGLDVIVSHQPSFRVGDQVQLALVRATPEEEQLLRGGESVYSVVGGLDGATATSGTILSQAQLNGETFTLLGVKWDSFPVTYRINPANDFLTPSQVTSIVQASFQEWEDDPFSDIDFVFGGTTGASSDAYFDDQNTLGWLTPTSPADNWLAQAVWVPSGGSILSFDIQFNSSYVFSEGALPGRFDLGTVALHEIGHILGLGHINLPGTENEVMFPSITSNTTKTLGPGDREGAADLYPAANPPTPGFCNNLVATHDMTLGSNGVGTPDNDVIIGTDGNDVIHGMGGNDTICGGLGDDVVRAGAGDDFVTAGPGVDRIFGGSGNDDLLGGPDRDVILGEDGDDEIWGESGRDSLFGGLGRDLIDGGEDTDLIKGGEGNDTLRAGSSGNDRIVGSIGHDVLDASATTGSTRLIGGDGNDTFYGSNQIDRIWGGTGADTAHAGGHNDLIRGDWGDDTLYGDEGDDIIDGGAGSDFLGGGNGTDYMVGMEGADTCHGGPGTDRAHHSCESLKHTP